MANTTSNQLTFLAVFLTIATSAFAISINNLNVSDVSSSSISLQWEVVDSSITENETAIDSFRSYVQVKYSLNFIVDTACLSLNTTTAMFTEVQPYIAYTTCIDVVRLAGTTCDNDSPIVSTKQVCTSVITDFVPWSYFNLTAIGCLGGIILVLIVVVAINLAVPKKNAPKTVDRKKMKAWSQSKGRESVNDFLRTLQSRENVKV